MTDKALEIDAIPENADWLLVLQRQHEAAGGPVSDATLQARLNAQADKLASDAK
jgi:hypothetical protein